MKSLKKKINLLLIDPQNSFAHKGDANNAKGELYVDGADVDMERVADFINRVGDKLHDISVTLDSHHLIHIANPAYWMDNRGDHPTPFTTITVADVKSGKWVTTKPSLATHALKYLESLEKNHRYQHMIWPPHCLIGSWGYGVYPIVDKALRNWCESQFATIDWVTKGSNPNTEHFSAFQAEVPDPADPSTQVNTGLIRRLEECDDLLITGIAGSHCVANSVRDLANNISDQSYVQKFVLLTDTISPVTGCEKLQNDFVTEMMARGMRLSTTDKYLK